MRRGLPISERPRLLRTASGWSRWGGLSRARFAGLRDLYTVKAHPPALLQCEDLILQLRDPVFCTISKEVHIIAFVCLRTQIPAGVANTSSQGKSAATKR